MTAAPHRTESRRGAVWTETHEPSGRMQRIFGPLYITGITWFGFCSVGTRWLPYRVCSFIGWVATVVSWVLLRRVRRGITSNLNVVLGKAGLLERERRLYRTLRMFAHVTIDRYALFHRPHLMKVEVDGLDNWHAAAGGDLGCVLVSAHLGNWEVTSLVPASIEKQILVVREEEIDPQSQALLARLYKNHESPHFKILYAGDDASLGTKLLFALRRGSVVGLAGDQPRTGQGFVNVEMFGRPTPVPHGPAALARAAEVMILPVFGVRIGAMHYRVFVREPVVVRRTDDRHADVHDATQRVARQMEWAIGENPHSWFCWWPRWR